MNRFPSYPAASSSPFVEYFNGVTRARKVICSHSANVSESTLKKGLRAQEDIVVKMDSVIHAKIQSKEGGLIAEDSTLEKVSVSKQTKLTNTSAKTVKVKKDSLTITYRQQEVLPNFELLKAKLGIEMTNIAANEVRSQKGKILATNCRFKKVFSSQNIKLINTQVVGSLFIEVDPKQECRLILDGSTIEGDIVINSILSRKSTPINNTSMAAHDVHNAFSGLFGSTKTLIIANQVRSGELQINLKQSYKRFSDIPEWELEMFKTFCEEGEHVKLNQFNCILSNGKFSEISENKLEASKNEELDLCTWQQLKAEIEATFGPGTYVERLEYKGGIFKVSNGIASIIQAPPDMKHTEISVFIQGGNIKGKVIFQNCEGKVVHELNEPVSQETKSSNFFSP